MRKRSPSRRAGEAAPCAEACDGPFWVRATSPPWTLGAARGPLVPWPPDGPERPEVGLCTEPPALAGSSVLGWLTPSAWGWNRANGGVRSGQLEPGLSPGPSLPPQGLQQLPHPLQQLGAHSPRPTHPAEGHIAGLAPPVCPGKLGVTLAQGPRAQDHALCAAAHPHPSPLQAAGSPLQGPQMPASLWPLCKKAGWTPKTCSCLGKCEASQPDGSTGRSLGLRPSVWPGPSKDPAQGPHVSPSQSGSCLRGCPPSLRPRVGGSTILPGLCPGRPRWCRA